jgi:hypothetical protein
MTKLRLDDFGSSTQALGKAIVVKTKRGGEKTLFPFSKGDISYAELLQAIDLKAKAGVYFSLEEKEYAKLDRALKANKGELFVGSNNDELYAYVKIGSKKMLHPLKKSIIKKWM